MADDMRIKAMFDFAYGAAVENFFSFLRTEIFDPAAYPPGRDQENRALNVFEIVGRCRPDPPSLHLLRLPLAAGPAGAPVPLASPRPDATWEPTVSMCVRCLQRCRPYIEAKLQSLVGQNYPADQLEILVYSDGSSDGTGSRLWRVGTGDPAHPL